MVQKFLAKFGTFLEKLDQYRDQVLFILIKPLWPKKISPNQLSYMRIIIGLALFILLFFFNIENKLLIVSLFCIGAISDLFDGSVARGLNKVTEFGAMLDPVADRILILPIAIYSLIEHHKWLLLSLLLAELLGALVSIFHKSKESDVKANIFGKTKMFLLSLVFVAILIAWPNEPHIFFVNIVWTSLLFAVLSVFVRILELNTKGFIKNKYENI
ncbi:MAG: CDP-alcohol phosphatidyltransferase family protein [Candidatus Staskawiczbacteria bacterium]|jgi:CDP-diacylglycerol--glycerol-3-phosphate 3-phosphatidyltransferase